MFVAIFGLLIKTFYRESTDEADSVLALFLSSLSRVGPFSRSQSLDMTLLSYKMSSNVWYI